MTERRKNDTVGGVRTADPVALTDLADQVVSRARHAGADVAEAVVSASAELSARVRLGVTDLVTEAVQRSIVIRVIRADRSAVSTTTDLTRDGIDHCVANALALSALSEPDVDAGPALPSELLARGAPDLDLFDPAVAGLGVDEALGLARDAEAAALAHDERLAWSEGATLKRTVSEHALALSLGFSGSYRATQAVLRVSPVARDIDSKRRRCSHWTSRRHLADLPLAAAVGEEAGRRTLAQLGARQVSSTEAPVVFHPDAGRDLLAAFAECVLGGAIWRQSSYLVGREGTRVASEVITIADDPLLPRGPGSRPFDGEGLPTRRVLVVERGQLTGYLLDCTSARKLGRASTGSASRTAAGLSPTVSNFILAPTGQSAEALVASTARGLYVMSLMGFGFNPVTGDFSRGAAGFWIEDGTLAFPVSEITISGNLDTVLRHIDAVANDGDPKTPFIVPTLRVASMTIGGS